MTVEMQALRRPAHHRATPLRLSPQHGGPRCLMEQVVQHVWKRKLLWYVAAVATIGVVLQFALDRHLHKLLFG